MSHGGKGACSGHGGVDKSGAATAATTAAPAATAAPATSAPAAAAPAATAPATKSTGAASEGKGPPTAKCKDGTLSYSKHHTGTCSDHGGVAEWLDGTQQH